VKVHIYKVKNPDSCITEIVEVKSDATTDTLTHFVPPFGSPEIILYIGQTHQIKNVAFANGVIKGLYNISQKIDFIPNYHFLTIRLQPFGLKQLFNFNATDLMNSVIDIRNHPIGNALLDSTNVSGNLDVSLAKMLVSRIDHSAIYPVSTSTKAFIKMASDSSYHTVKDLIFESGIGLRTLQRNFKKDVGLSPKEYLRVKRLNAIEQKMSQNVHVFEIIADFDFSDQAHFIKDFKQLRNFTPTEILKKKLLLSDQLAIPKIFSI
jgi:AraC-like DNA-binding protein